MNIHTKKNNENRSSGAANNRVNENLSDSFAPFLDNRPEAILQRRLQKLVNTSSLLLKRSNIPFSQRNIRPGLQRKPIQNNDHKQLSPEADETGGDLFFGVVDSQKNNSLNSVAQLVKVSELKPGQHQETAASRPFRLFLSSKGYASALAVKTLEKTGELDGCSVDQLVIYIEEFLKVADAGRLPVDENAKRLFDIARAQLGTPLNDPSWKQNTLQDNQDEAIAGKLYNDVKTAMGISTEDVERNSKDKGVVIEWMIKTAALASALGGGVCNSFGSLTAIMLRLEGAKGVKLYGNDMHNWAEYGEGGGKRTLDPWKDKEYIAEGSQGKGTELVDLDRLDQERLYDAYKRYEAIALNFRDKLAPVGYGATQHAKRALYEIVWE